MSAAPEHDQLRIGTAEREEAAKLLGEHYSQGRLTADEYETRVAAAYDATTLADLRPLFRDLPGPHPMSLRPFGPPPAMPFVPQQTNPYAAPAQYRPPPLPAVYSPRSKTIAGVLQIVFPMGVGRFYTGHIGIAIAQLLVFVVTLGVGAVWPIVDGILLLINGGTDNNGRPLSP